MKYILIFLLFLSIIGSSCKDEPVDIEKSLIETINDYREEKNLYTISESPALNTVAEIHINDLIENYTINEECNLHSWSENEDWSSCCYSNDQANADCMWVKPAELTNYTGYGYEIAVYSSNGMDKDVALNLWINSEAHHNLIINKGIWKDVEWKAIGAAVKGNYALIWFGEEADEEK
ncbi:MAG: CAP domain-containing protein [Prolixibacteraceae bacterium]|jgi:hypothetical protein|nr:CAP domain-containing protein [Prolixibacteraceae bacterium]